jgi:ssDNA-binding Zn-finger/Zn-ribbon topoisomerase 1
VLRSWKGKRFVGCSNYPKCHNSFPLPQKGRISLNQEKCPACGNIQVNILHGRRKPWTVCLNAKCPTRAEREAARRAKKEAKEAAENGEEGGGAGENKDDRDDEEGHLEPDEKKKEEKASGHRRDDEESGTAEGETEPSTSEDIRAGE